MQGVGLLGCCNQQEVQFCPCTSILSLKGIVVLLKSSVTITIAVMNSARETPAISAAFD